MKIEERAKDLGHQHRRISGRKRSSDTTAASPPLCRAMLGRNCSILTAGFVGLTAANALGQKTHAKPGNVYRLGKEAGTAV